MKKVVNLMEEVVSKTIDEILANRSEICQCDQCRADMYALALNNLKPMYAVSDKGKALFNVMKTTQQGRADIVSTVMYAIETVSNNVKH
ncbi:MAG: late competence development ComFB family protein [Cellulosilyticaceae bacterium]